MTRPTAINDLAKVVRLSDFEPRGTPAAPGTTPAAPATPAVPSVGRKTILVSQANLEIVA